MILPFILLIGLLLVQTIIYSQEDQEKIEERQQKLELILRYKDTRTIYDGKLISFLTDTDKVVREKAVEAFGSIQDTSVINLLVDRLSEDPELSVQFNAAFAIGQTAGGLSKRNREILEHDLIWTRLDRLPSEEDITPDPAGRLIEELGKFGTEQALKDLMLRFGDVYPQVYVQPLIMSVARFAIRGITTKETVQYLIKYIKSNSRVAWQAVYALQRIGDNPEIRHELENIAKLYDYPDPLVRMNLATLLGKVRDERICLIPLQKMADFDRDWRVRVNALKSLSKYDLRQQLDIVETFRRSFFDKNIYVALTALASFGNTGLKKDEAIVTFKRAFDALEQIGMNKDYEFIWQLQAEAAVALANLEGREALDMLVQTEWPQNLLKARLLIAMGMTGAPEAAEILFKYVDHDDKVLYLTALEGLHALSRKNPNDTTIVDRTYHASIDGLRIQDVAIVATAASILGDSLFRRLTSIEPLIESLSNQQVPEDIEAIQEIVATLGRIGDHRAVAALRRVLQLRDRSIRRASATALKAITGETYDDIPKYFEPIFTDFDFAYLRTFPDTIKVKMETIHGEIIMELYKAIAPFTVQSFLKLTTRRKFFDGLTFHRVVPNFVIQGGDPLGDGWGGPGYSIRSEFSSVRYETGTIGMASAGKDTEGSQFFITQSPQPHLDGRYTIFGKVVSGMKFVNQIQVDDHILSIKVLE